MLRLCYAHRSLTACHTDLSVLWSLKMLRALADRIEFGRRESSERDEPARGLTWLGLRFWMLDVQDKRTQESRNFPRISRAKTLNGIREMRIYFGSVATRSEVQRNVGRISADEDSS